MSALFDRITHQITLISFNIVVFVWMYFKIEMKSNIKKMGCFIGLKMHVFIAILCNRKMIQEIIYCMAMLERIKKTKFLIGMSYFANTDI